MLPVPSPAISSSLFFLIPLLLLVLVFQPSSSPRLSMVPAQLIQTLIAILAFLVATLGLAGLYKAEMIVEALFVFVLQSTVVYIIVSLSSFSQYGIALIVILFSATLFSLSSILVQLPTVLNYLPLIFLISFCLATFKILFQLILTNQPRRPTPLTDVNEDCNINVDTIESGLPPVQYNPFKTTLLVSFTGQFLFLLFCALRISSLASRSQGTANQQALETAQTILLILSSLCSTFVFSQYSRRQGLQYASGDQKRTHLAAAHFGAFKTMNGLCGASSDDSDVHDASNAVNVSGSSQVSQTSIISDASITSTPSMPSIASGASDVHKRVYTSINPYSKNDDDNDSVSPSLSVSAPSSLSRQSRWSRFIALASIPATNMPNKALLAPFGATDTTASSEECTPVSSRFTLDIGRSSTFTSSIPSIPSICSSRLTAPSIHSIQSNSSMLGSISSLYTIPSDAASSLDITTSVTGVTGAMGTVTLTATPFLHPAAAMLSNPQNSRDKNTLASTYGMIADYGLMEHADEDDGHNASIRDQGLCPLRRGLNPHITYSTNHDRGMGSDASSDAIVTAIPLLQPATTSSQASQVETNLAYKHDRTADYAESVTNCGIVNYTDEMAGRQAHTLDQSLYPLCQDLSPHITCLTNRNRALASDVSLGAAGATLDFDSGSARLVCHKESMNSLTSSTYTSPSSSTTTLGISTTTSMRERAVSWSSTSVAVSGNGRQNVAMKMKMTGGIPLGKCVPLDVLTRNFMLDEDEARTDSPDSLTPYSEFSPPFYGNECQGSKRTKPRGSWGQSMSETVGFEMGISAHNLPSIGQENVKKSRTGSAFSFGGWGKFGRAREDDRNLKQEQEQGQGHGHRKQRSRGLSFSIGRMMKGRSLSISLLSGLMKSRSKRTEGDDDDETQNVLGRESVQSSSLFSGTGRGSRSPMFSSLSLSFYKGLAESKGAINESRNTLVTAPSAASSHTSPSSSPTSQGKKSYWKTVQRKKSYSMIDDTYHRPADFMDMRDPFAPPVLGIRRITSSSSSLVTPSSLQPPAMIGGGGRTRGNGRERGRNLSCPGLPYPTTVLDTNTAQQQHEEILDVEEALLTQRLLMRLDLSPSPF